MSKQQLKGDRMTRRLSTITVILFAATLDLPLIGQAQAFKVEKFDIKGDGGIGRTMSLSKPPRDVFSCRAAPT